VFAQVRFEIAKQAFIARDNLAGCWYACVRQKSADQIVKILTEAGHTAEVRTVDHRGRYILPKGVAAIDAEGEEDTGTPIRPWNERRSEWEALTDEQKEENRKEWKPKEFYVSIVPKSWINNFVYVVPASWFDQHSRFPDEEYDLSHILPNYLNAIRPWAWKTSVDNNTVDFDILNKSKYSQKLKFTLFINCL
jgi:(2Fe-2S) ferredoxin